MTLGLVSDTHLRAGGRGLPEPLLAAFEGVDLILHAGDINDLEVLVPLELLAPVTAVYGNTDPWSTCERLSETRRVEAGGLSIGLVHGHTGRGAGTLAKARSWFADADVVVFGHSHQALIERIEGQLLVNPGSACQPRFGRAPSCALLTIEAGVATARLVHWPAR